LAGLITTPMLTVLHTPPFFELINAIAARRKRGGGFYTTVSRSNAAVWSDLVPHCAVIPNGIDLDLWRPAYKLTKDHAFWYGRLVADKGAHLALDAAHKARIPIRIAGRSEDLQYFKKEILPRLGPHATYLGHLDRNALVGEIGHSAVCIVTPCWDEPFGLVVAESFACGTPVVAFSRGAMPELITAETGILVEPGNVAALANALVAARVLDRRACRSRAEKLWSLDLMTSRYETLLEEISLRARVDA
jgi:glycosyltransferase involved in cell wall biosynthesis